MHVLLELAVGAQVLVFVIFVLILSHTEDGMQEVVLFALGARAGTSGRIFWEGRKGVGRRGGGVGGGGAEWEEKGWEEKVQEKEWK